MAACGITLALAQSSMSDKMEHEFLKFLDVRIKRQEVERLYKECCESNFLYKWQSQSYKIVDSYKALAQTFWEVCNVDFIAPDDQQRVMLGRWCPSAKMNEGRTTPIESRELHFNELMNSLSDVKFSMSWNDDWVKHTSNILAAGCFIISMAHILHKWKSGEALTVEEQFAICEMYARR